MGSDDRALADEAVELARSLLVRSHELERPSERRRRERLGRLLARPAGRELVFALTDQVLRIDDPKRAASRFRAVVRDGSAAELGILDRSLLRAGAVAAGSLPRAVMPLVRRRIAAETRGVVLPADEPAFSRYVARRHREGVRLNVNPLGEAILSDAEAAARLDQILVRIARPDVDYVSLKLSAIVANLDAWAFDRSVERVSERLRTVYRTAAASSPRTFVNLDMEEYRDLELTLTSFIGVLSEGEFAALDAGIVLQAYLPDSHAALERLGEWALARHERGGGTIKVRIVKGANLAMERVEAELHGWVPAPYDSKAAVDASFKRLLDSALRPAWAPALRVGVGSHNLFDVAWALVMARVHDAADRVEIEMLEGMAPAQARAVQELAGGLLLYAPVVRWHELDASIAYLTRRLDENTQADNFLRALFDLEPDSDEWHAQAARFRTAVEMRHDVRAVRRRRPLTGRPGVFTNEPDSDPTDPAARTAMLAAVAPDVAVVRFTATDQVDEALARARSSRWGTAPPAERRSQIRAATAEMRRARAESVAVMADETGKTIGEADPEVSEAIDFGEYYAGPGIDLLAALAEDGLDVRGRGVVAVIGPWNFPYAIPAGGVFAALAAGNAVVLKPAPESVRVAATLVDQLHRAGIPDDAVQLVVCEDGPVGRHLVTHAEVDTVILTGSLDTAELFLSWRPDLRLFAETSGKNALVVTAAADLDLAFADLVRSAFGHAGQKCSAASLAIVEAPLYDDPAFHDRLRSIVESWRVAWPSDPSAMIGPVIQPPTGPLARAVSTVEPDERWLVRPRRLDESGRLWAPGVRTGVLPGTWFHRTECFGPVLGVMRADDLDHAIEIQNDSDFGLTGGLHSLDPEEIERWLERVEVGNAYVNRHITGAVVQRQPFGGWKRSQVGPGAKAGGPSYILQFARMRESTPWPIERVRTSYRTAWNEFFAVEHDPSRLRSEANVLRHRRVARVVARHHGESEPLDRLRAASEVTGVPLVESDADAVGPDTFLQLVDAGDRVRFIGDVEPDVRDQLVARGIWFDVEPPSPHGRVELLRWVREQSISRTLHRHGRLPD